MVSSYEDKEKVFTSKIWRGKYYKLKLFYLTKRIKKFHLSEDVVPLYIMENNKENASNKRTTAKYFIKSTVINNGDGTYSRYEDGVDGHDVSLDFYPAEVKVTQLNSLYYVTDSLTVDPETGDYNCERE